MARIPSLAGYSGDANFQGGTSTALSQVVTIAQGPYGKVVPTALNFGSVLLGQTSPTKLAALSNTGLTQLTVSNISISGAFSLSNNSCNNGVKPQTHCNVSVAFTPTALGTQTGTLTFTDNAPDSPQTVSLTGTGSNMATTTTTLASSPRPSSYGQAVTFTAKVTSIVGAPPNGETVSFMEGPAVLGTGSLTDGSASFTSSALSVGPSTVTAVYGGELQIRRQHIEYRDADCEQGRKHDHAGFVVEPVGQSVTFTASVKPQFSGTPTGTVTFKNGTATLATVALSGGVAKYTTAKLAVGTEPITAVYSDSSSFTTNSSGTLSQVVNQAGTTTTLISSLDPSKFGQSVTFTATLKPQFSGTPAGTVTFKDGTTTLDTGALSSGINSPLQR
jgi:hypothetical protein